MKSDIEIAQEAKMEPIVKIAETIGTDEPPQENIVSFAPKA